jgi:hypothetical protein
MAPLLRDEDIDLTVNELMRIRGRPSQIQKVQGLKGLRVQGKRGSRDKGEKKPRVRRK